MTAPACTPGGAGNAGTQLATRLQVERTRLMRASLGARLLAGAGAAALVLAAAGFLLADGRWMSLPRALPIAAWLLAAGLAALAVRWCLRRDAAVLDTRALATRIEQEQRLRDGSLRGALEVAGSGELGAYAAADIARRLGAGVLAPQAALDVRRTLLIGGAMGVAGLALLGGAGRGRPDGVAAVLQPVAAWRGTLLAPLAFERVPRTVPRGMPVTLTVQAAGRHTLTVSRRVEGEASSDTTLVVDETGVARLPIGPVRANMTLQVSDGRSTPLEAVLVVEDRGWLGDVALRRLAG